MNTYAHGEYYMCEIKMEESELLDCYQWFPRFGLFLNYICGPPSHFYFENFQSRFSGHANLAQLKLHLTWSAFPLSTPAKKSPQNWRMCPATTHVEKVVAVIITTLTLNIVQYVTDRLEQPLVVLATNNFLWVELHRLYTPWIQEATKANYYQTILAPSAPVNFLMELCWPSFSFTLRHWQFLSITDILRTVSAIGITLLTTSLACSQDF